MEEDADADSVGEFGCVWDNTGSGDADRMNLNCDRLSEEECVAADNGNKDGRCVWKARSHEKGAHKDSITVADKEQAAAKKVAMAGAEYVQLDEDEGAEVAPLGCLWDATGCAHDMCDQARSTCSSTRTRARRWRRWAACGTRRAARTTCATRRGVRAARRGRGRGGGAAGLPVGRDGLRARHVRPGAEYVQLDEDEGAEVAPLGCLWDA